MADVVVRLGHTDIKLGVGRNAERFTCPAGKPNLAALQFVFATSRHARHDFRRTGVECQGGWQDNPDRFVAAIGQCDAVTDALAVKIDIGPGVDRHVVQRGGGRGTCHGELLKVTDEKGEGDVVDFRLGMSHIDPLQNILRWQARA